MFFLFLGLTRFCMILSNNHPTSTTVTMLRPHTQSHQATNIRYEINPSQTGLSQELNYSGCIKENIQDPNVPLICIIVPFYSVENVWRPKKNFVPADIGIDSINKSGLLFGRIELIQDLLSKNLLYFSKSHRSLIPWFFSSHTLNRWVDSLGWKRVLWQSGRHSVQSELPGPSLM